jgi:hypothetical protein
MLGMLSEAPLACTVDMSSVAEITSRQVSHPGAFLNLTRYHTHRKGEERKHILPKSGDTGPSGLVPGSVLGIWIHQ